ncbi:MAG: sensor histidine kinase [Oscillospiraceae bacterium]|nr:sensor histidine kinase [Oscillospiraceae bacterium]
MTPLTQEIIHAICFAPSSFIADLACAQMLRLEKRFRYAAILTVLHAAFQILAGMLRLHGIPGAVLINSVLQISVYFIPPLLLSRLSKIRTLFASAICLTASMAASTIAELAYVSLGGEIRSTVALFESNPAIYIIMFVICFVLLALMLPLLIRFWDRMTHTASDQTFWYYLLFPVSQVLLWSVAILYTSLDTFIPSRHIPLAVVTVFCFIAEIFLLRSLQVFSKRAMAEERAVWYEHLLDQQQNYYAHLLAETEDASKIRHDIRNQLQTAYALMESGDTEAARSQLDGIRAAVEQQSTFCENHVVNALLSVKAGQFAEAGLTLDCRCKVPMYISIPGVELCSLFANILDNAYQAASRYEGEDRTVRIASALQGKIFTVRCQNPCPPEDAPKGKRPGHGLGLEILRDLAERHNGILETNRDGSTFTTQVQLVLD